MDDAPDTDFAFAHDGRAMAGRWTRDQVAGAGIQTGHRIPVIEAESMVRMLPDLDLWDMWQLMRPDGATVAIDGHEFWFFLAAPVLVDPEDRHDVARIRLLSRCGEAWTDRGWVMEGVATPGSREWSGCAVLHGATLTLYFTAAGRRDVPTTFEQRLFESDCHFRLEDGRPILEQWQEPRESVAADGDWYKVADQEVAPSSGIWGFRDPAYFRDPATGLEHLLFCGSAGWTEVEQDGVIGLATKSSEGWELQPPLLGGVGVNSELERPHVIVRDGSYYLFWSAHRRRFAPGLDAPSGLYCMAADSLLGPWRPANGTGLVAGNPIDAPVQAYCWWVTTEGEVLSFVDYPGIEEPLPPRDPDMRRRTFGGMVAPSFHLRFDGDAVVPVFRKGS